jgi:hypothetical protein
VRPGLGQKAKIWCATLSPRVWFDGRACLLISIAPLAPAARTGNPNTSGPSANTNRPGAIHGELARVTARETTLYLSPSAVVKAVYSPSARRSIAVGVSSATSAVWPRLSARTTSRPLLTYCTWKREVTSIRLRAATSIRRSASSSCAASVFGTEHSVSWCRIAKRTLTAIAADEIVMDKPSKLGPIDPQITLTTATGEPMTRPAQSILAGLQEIVNSAQDQFSPAYLRSAERARTDAF